MLGVMMGGSDDGWGDDGWGDDGWGDDEVGLMMGGVM